MNNHGKNLPAVYSISHEVPYQSAGVLCNESLSDIRRNGWFRSMRKLTASWFMIIGIWHKLFIALDSWKLVATLVCRA